MDLTTQYLGLTLCSPIVPSSSPLSRSLETCRELEDSGAGAIILHSLFEETITAEGERQHEDGASTLNRYLENLRRLKARIDIPVLASLNGITPGGWLQYAQALEQAGADALELNVYYIAGDTQIVGHQVENRYLELFTSLRRTIGIPIVMKLAPWFSSVANMVKQLEAAGANGVALFNRFYEPDIDIDSLCFRPSLHPSTSAEALLPMRWIAMLRGRTTLSLGATSGIHTAKDAIKLLLAGADVVHMASALLEHGPGHVREVIAGIRQWMEIHDFATVDEFRGRLSQMAIPDPTELERANYVSILESYSFDPAKRV